MFPGRRTIVSTALQKKVEREFFRWIKSKPQGKITLWQAYLEGYSRGIENAIQVLSPIGEDKKAEKQE